MKTVAWFGIDTMLLIVTLASGFRIAQAYPKPETITPYQPSRW